MYSSASGSPPLRPPSLLPSGERGRWSASAYHQWDLPGPASVSHPPVPVGFESLPRRPISTGWTDHDEPSDVDLLQSPNTATELLSPESERGGELLAQGDGDGGSYGEQLVDQGSPRSPICAARQLARAMGADKFYTAFHERCPDGHTPVAGLPEILAAAGLTVSALEVGQALAKVCPEVSLAGSIPYTQCQDVYLHLHVEQHNLSAQDQDLANAGCLARWMATDTGATNVLLVIVVSLCALSAFLAAGVAILLLFLDGLSTINSHLQDDLGVFQDSLEVFATQITVQTDDTQATTFATTLAVVLKYIGYISSINREQTDILKMATAISNTMSSWLSLGPEKAFISLAALGAVLTNASLARYGLSQTVAVINGINTGGMTSNYELALARWLNTSNNTVVEYLNNFRYTVQCPKTGCVTNATVQAPMKLALAGNTFAQYVMDYRAISVYAGFTSTSGLGVEIQCSQSGYFNKRQNQVTNIIQSWTLNSGNSYEYLVAKRSGAGVGTLLVPPLNCSSTSCQKLVMSPGWPMYNALLGQTGVTQFTNHRGNAAMAAYTMVADQPYALVVQMELSDINKTVLVAVASMLNRLNSQYAETSQEFELSTFQDGGDTSTITHLTPYRFGAQCLSGQCVLTPYVLAAVDNCSTGVMRTTDYRGHSVLVGYSCISELSAVVSVKVDMDDNEADTLQAILQAVDARTAEDTDTSAQYLLATPKAGLTADNVTGYSDFVVRSKLKYPNACANRNCSWDSASALHALQDRTDVLETTDYRGVAVRAAPARSAALSYGIGLALETDSHELLQPMVDTAIKVGSFAVGMVVLSTLLLVVITKLFLRSMITAKEEGRAAVENEKDRLSRLVSSMYPAYILPQLLEGEKQMVCEVPGAAVFFSDIHEFTSVSNAMPSKDLLLLMGYVYGVMDHIAARFGVYKVKTIGDAYLAVLGLPGTTSENISLDLLRFASCVCQVFGDRFVHPIEGQVLAAMNKAMQWNARPGQVKCASMGSGTNSSLGLAKGGPASERPSVAPSYARKGRRMGSRASTALAESLSPAQDQVQCVMSYGLAVGKVVAGVLGGRCPMFDIWGVTVNLASRMQSTGEPGRIQVSEQLYRRVVAVPEQPFTFEMPRSVFCKGFGNVNAYMVRTTAQGLPRDLQNELRLEPRYGEFFFHDILSVDAPLEAPLGRAVR